jgi:outer membrane protein OmpA-like peptidoglycan-associated protein
VRKAEQAFKGAYLAAFSPLKVTVHGLLVVGGPDSAPRRGMRFEGQTMPTSHYVQDATKNALLRVSHPMQDEGISAEKGRLWHAVRVAASIFAGAGLLSTANGCIATRSWVQGQLNPIKGQLVGQESQLNDTNAKADRALAGLQNLHLERRLVLDSSHGPTFASGSAALTEDAKHEIDGFFQDVEGSTNSGSASGRFFVIAGHTDSVGPEYYNYDLGLQRAMRVAGYLVAKEGVDPTQVRAVSYGASKPIADNSTPRGRRSNRRVEILLYQETITTGS